jgi:RNase P subunit RPR2
MICKFCKHQFDAAQSARIGMREGDSLEVKTQCPGCGEVFYQFTLSHGWTSERHALALARKANGGGQ